MKYLARGTRFGLVLGMICLFGLLHGAVRGEAGDFEVYKEGKGVVLEVADQKFSVGVGRGFWGYDWLDIDKVAGVPGYGSSFCTNFLCPEYKGWGNYFAAGHIQEIKVVFDNEDEKVVYLKAKAYNHSEKKIVEPYYMEMNLRIKKGFPCLFIYQRVTNSADCPKNLSFGNYVRSFSTYAGADLKKNEIIRRWNALANKANFLWAKREITEKTEGSKGLGMISFIPTSFSTGPRGHIYFGYAKGTVEEGDYLESKWAVMAAESPEEAKGIYEKIKDMELESFLRPGEQTVMLSNSKSGI